MHRLSPLILLVVVTSLPLLAGGSVWSGAGGPASAGLLWLLGRGLDRPVAPAPVD